MNLSHKRILITRPKAQADGFAAALRAHGADRVVPVDLYIPGCPPHPLTILDGILRLLGRIEPA